MHQLMPVGRARVTATFTGAARSGRPFLHAHFSRSPGEHCDMDRVWITRGRSDRGGHAMSGAVKYAIVGTGSVGAVLARRFSDHHVPTLWANTRGPETIDVTELSAAITPVTLDAALDADVIVLAIPFLQVRELGGRRADWSGKIVVDTTNAFLVPNSEQILGGRLSTEFNAEAFPGAAVVKSFNQTAARQLAEKRPPEFGKRVVFVASNDSAASAVVAELCTDLGFAPIELGRLHEGGVLIQARNALVLRELYELPSELEKSTQVT